MGQGAATAIHPKAEEHPKAYQPATQPRAPLWVNTSGVQPAATRESHRESGRLGVPDDENADIESVRGSQLQDWPSRERKKQ